MAREIIVLTEVDESLIENGFDRMPLYDRTRLITQISNSTGKHHNQITEEDVLSYHKHLKRNMLSERCEGEILRGFQASNGHFYRTNRDDQINMIGQKDMLSRDESITTVSWKTEDEGYIEHTREEWLQVYDEAFEHKQNNLFKYDRLRNAVLRAETHDEIVAIKWDSEVSEN